MLIAAQPTRGLDVGAIEFVHRRLIEERDEGRAILLVSLELEEVLSLSDRILVMYEGEIVGEFPPTATEEELGFAMTGGSGAESQRERRRLRAIPPVQPYGQPSERPDEPPDSFAARLALAQRAGGLLAPLLTVLIAFVMGGLVVARHDRQEPARDLQGDLRGRRAQLALPWVTGRTRVDRGVQPPADAHRDDDADPRRPRRRLRVPLRPVQHRRPGPVPVGRDPRRLDRLVVRRAEPGPPRPARARGRHAMGACSRVSPGSSRRPSAPTR